MRFLRGLARHNERPWFEERRPIYERALKQPLHALVEEINLVLGETAPDYVRPPHKVAMRIFRDTRFSPDKRPYKQHVGAWWARRGAEKTAAPGFYLQVGPAGVFAAAGVYDPEREDLLRVRRWLSTHHERYRAGLKPLLTPRGKQAAFLLLEPNALTRNPKGFAPDDPASDLLRARNWGVRFPFEVEAALRPGFGQDVASAFCRMMPLVALLNEPFLEHDARRTATSHTSHFPI